MGAKTPSTDKIVKQVFDLDTTFPTTAVELEALLAKAARLGKISGLRRARKHLRGAILYGTDPFANIAGSIKGTYEKLGADTDAYEQEQTDKIQARLDAELGTIAYEAGVAALTDPDTIAGFAGMEPFTLPGATVITDQGVTTS